MGAPAEAEREVKTWMAALGAALHREWQIFAVSGLETAPFTLLLLGGYLLVVWNRDRPSYVAAAGALFALAALTRHDGVVPALVCGIYLLLFARRRWRAAIFFGLAFAMLWIPFTAWRVSYYGDFFPNSYYAKSAYLTWYSQGLRYLSLYLEKYWALALGTCLGGNATVIGAAANIVTAGVAERAGYPVSFKNFARVGVPVTFVTLAISTLYLLIRY